VNNSDRYDSTSTHDDLIQAYLDGETTPEQEEQVRRLLNEPAFCERLAQFALNLACLHELAHQGVLEQPDSLGSGDRETSSPNSGDFVYKERKPSRQRLRDAPVAKRAGYFLRNRLVQAGTVLVVLLLLLVVVVPFWLNRKPDEKPAAEKPALGRLREVASAVIVREGLDDESGQVGSILRSGDTLQNEGPEGFATFVFHDGTMLVLAGDTKVSLTQDGGQKRVDVHHGDVDADVAPQPDGKPMLFVTLLAEVRVMGTRLSISAETDGTTLSVTEGLVVMKRLSDGRSVNVRAGYHAVASPHTELAAQPTPSAPDAWSADFEDGLPDNWRLGQWVTDDLPENSKGAVRSARWATRSGLYYTVRSNKVTTGLFRVHDDTHLNFTYKMDQPGWFNLFVVVNRNDGDRSRTGNYAHQEAAWWRIPASEWRTASVPLTRFHKVVRGRSKDEPKIYAQAGDAVNSIWFSTPEKDRGLTIDRMWVTRGKPAD